MKDFSKRKNQDKRGININNNKICIHKIVKRNKMCEKDAYNNIVCPDGISNCIIKDKNKKKND